MEFLENYIDEQEEIKSENSIFRNIGKDFSSIAWVAIVLMLIIGSYLQTEAVMPKNAKLDMYKLSITEQVENDIVLK